MIQNGLLGTWNSKVPAGIAYNEHNDTLIDAMWSAIGAYVKEHKFSCNFGWTCGSKLFEIIQRSPAYKAVDESSGTLLDWTVLYNPYANNEVLFLRVGNVALQPIAGVIEIK